MPLGTPVSIYKLKHQPTRSEIRRVWLRWSLTGFQFLAGLITLERSWYFESDRQDNEVLRHYIGNLLELYHDYREVAPSKERLLIGYFSVDDIRTDIVMAYEGAIRTGFLDDDGRADYALVKHYLDVSDAASIFPNSNESYHRAVRRVVAGQELDWQDRRWIQNEISTDPNWWTQYLSELGGVSAPPTSPPQQVSYYQRALNNGTLYFLSFAVSAIFLIPAWSTLFGPAKFVPSRLMNRMHPAIGIALVCWSIIAGRAALWFAAFNGIGGDNAVMLCLQYLIFLGAPVLLIVWTFLPGWSALFRLTGLTWKHLFSKHTLVLVAAG